MRTSISTELREELGDIVTCQDGDGEDENEEEEDSEEQTGHEDEEDVEDGEEGKVDKYYLTAFDVYADGQPPTTRLSARLGHFPKAVNTQMSAEESRAADNWSHAAINIMVQSWLLGESSQKGPSAEGRQDSQATGGATTKD
jgi:hypothetical protein